MQPDTHALASLQRHLWRYGLVCCLCALLMAPLQTVANFALACLPVACEEHPTETAGTEHVTQSLSHHVRRQWLVARRPGFLLPFHALTHLARAGHSALHHPELFEPARPHAGAGVRARC
jgi:hypothetical protein